MNIHMKLYDAANGDNFGESRGNFPIPRIGEALRLAANNGATVICRVSDVIYDMPNGSADVATVLLYVELQS